MTRHTLVPLRVIFAAMIVAVCGAADWPQFRGPDNGSITQDTSLPIQWSVDDARWSIALPGRCVSGPIVVGDQVVTTGSSGQQNERLHIFCVDKSRGGLLWQRNLWATGRTLCHPLTCMAALTPATDGQRIDVLFASNDLVCLDLEGNLLWMRAIGLEHPLTFDDRGMGSSPLLVDGTLVLQMECQGDSFALGIDCSAGQTLWQRKLPSTINWLSPATLRVEGKGLALLQTSDKLLVVEPKTGDVVSSYETPGTAIASPVAQDGKIFMPSKGLTALQYQASSDQLHLLWQENRLGAQTSSPVVGHGRLYVIRSPNLLACGDVETGRELWKIRLSGKQYWATPILAGDYLYVVSAEGLIQVVDVRGDEPKLMAKNDMQEEMLGSPAVSDGAIYLRGVSQLWKIGR